MQTNRSLIYIFFFNLVNSVYVYIRNTLQEAMENIPRISAHQQLHLHFLYFFVDHFTCPEISSNLCQEFLKTSHSEIALTLHFFQDNTDVASLQLVMSLQLGIRGLSIKDECVHLAPHLDFAPPDLFTRSLPLLKILLVPSPLCSLLLLSQDVSRESY